MLNIIRWMIIALLLFMTTGLLQGCTGSSPVGIARNFTEALYHGKLELAKSYATEQTAQMIDMGSSMGAWPVKPDYRFKLVSQEVNGNEATVKYIDEKGAESDLHLARLDGRWKVHESK
jgi:hypothetical protein